VNRLPPVSDGSREPRDGRQFAEWVLCPAAAPDGPTRYPADVSAMHEPRAPLSDGVVVLRAWREEDAPAVAAGLTDPEFRRQALFDAPGSGEQQAADLLSRAAERDRAQLDLAIADGTQPNRVLGGCSLHSADQVFSRVGVGYWLLPSARGMGAASRAVILLSYWALGPLGFARVELTCGPANTASQRVAQLSGFTREGTLRDHVPQRGGRRDSVMWSLVASDLA